MGGGATATTVSLFSFITFFGNAVRQKMEAEKSFFPKDKSSPNKAVDDTKIQNAGKNENIFANIADVCVSGRMGKEEAGCARGREHPAEREPTNAMIQTVIIVKTVMMAIMVIMVVMAMSAERMVEG